MEEVLLMLAFVFFVLFFAFGVCWLWPDYVDEHEPGPARRIMIWILVLESCVEGGIWLSGIVRWWVVIAVFLANAWGMLDAFLRYPVVHDIDSPFGIKQVVLLLLKLVAYALGFKQIEKKIGWFVLIVLCCVFSLPILWLVALPIGDGIVYHQKHDRVDVDIAIRCWRAIALPVERAEAILHFRRVGRQLLLQVSEVAPFLQPAVLKLDPSLGRLLRKAPRGV